MLQYVLGDIYPHPYIVPRRINISDYSPVFPDADNSRPFIVHSTTAPIAKGTPAVLKAIERLKDRYEFDFQLIQNVSRKDALKIMQQADIYLDQFVLGDFGMASIEAMAFGKPVVCYVKPSLQNVYGDQLPIVNATQDNLVDHLERLICDGRLRYAIGQQSYDYVSSTNDMKIVAPILKTIYSELYNSAHHHV